MSTGMALGPESSAASQTEAVGADASALRLRWTESAPSGDEVRQRSRELHRFDRRGPALRLVNSTECEVDARRQGEVAHANRIAARVAAEIGAERYARFFAGQVRLHIEGGSIRLATKGKAAAGLLERRFGKVLRAAAAQELGVSEVNLEVVAEATENESAAVGEPVRSAAQKPQEAASVRAGIDRTGRHYRLEDFLVGESNRLAYNAAVRLCEEHGEGEALSLLFFHGPCGVGKTHLLHGVANRYRETHPGAVVRITTGEQFMNEFVLAIKGGSFAPKSQAGRDQTPGQMNTFRRQYRRCDLLCIDDVHFLASKQATQQELQHTFDEIARSGARVVLACDQHPRNIPAFSPALVSRFMSGLVATVDPPDADLRERVIRLLATRRGLVLEPAAVRLLVDRTRALPGQAPVSMRELEGLITRVDAMHRLGSGGESAPVGVGVAERALGGDSGSAGESTRLTLAALGGRPVRIEKIMMQTCTALGVEMSDLAGPTRHKRVVLARAVITHLSKNLTTMSYPEIARAIGRPSHSTVITAHQRLSRQIEADEVFGIGPTGEAMTVGGLVRQLATQLTKG